MRTNEAVIEAVKRLNNSEYGATGIKVELEAHLSRTGDCYDCDGSGEIWHSACDGDGCDDCSNGYTDCASCGNNDTEYRSESNCFEFILNHLCQTLYNQSLEERREERGDDLESISSSHSNYYLTDYQLIDGLAYAEFYNDGSVDSEFTFTVKTDNPENIHIIPKAIEAFKALAAEIGNPIAIERAGMHMAVLQGENAFYPVRSRWSESRVMVRQWENFRAGMTPLLPALYLLGTSCGITRSMEFRHPRVSYTDKYSAIYYNGGAMEFRVFDTCYDNPEATLDNIMVMEKAMRYWAETPKKSIDLPRDLRFGNENGRELTRLYCSERHIELLNKGLALLKPGYYSVREIKKQRGFNLTRASVKAKVSRAKREAEIAYREYEQRFEWGMKARELRFQSDFMEQQSNRRGELPDEATFAQRMSDWVNSRIGRERRNKQTLDQHIELALRRLNNEGDFTLAV
jgi:hypothetical protein